MSLLWARPSLAQLPVVEVGLNLVQNTITATQSLVHTAKWILELTGLPTVILTTGEFAEDLATLTRLVQEGQSVGMDLASLQAQLKFFELEAAPETSQGLYERANAIRGVVFLAYSFAMRTQTLIATTLRTTRHVMRLLKDMAVAVGVLQADQSIAQHTAELVQIESELKLSTSAFQHAESLEALEGPLFEQGVVNINKKVWEDWEKGDTGL